MSNPSMASSRRPHSHAPLVAGVATGPAIASKMSSITLQPNRLRAWVIALAVGGVQDASQHPHDANDPVTLVATSS